MDAALWHDPSLHFQTDNWWCHWVDILASIFKFLLNKTWQ
jgi:hypothetical protein